MVFSSIASAVYKIEHFKFWTFKQHDINMAARGLSRMLKKNPYPVIFNNLNNNNKLYFHHYKYIQFCKSVKRNL